MCHCLSLSLPVCLSVCLCLLVRLSVSLGLSLSVTSICLSVGLYVLVCLSVCLRARTCTDDFPFQTSWKIVALALYFFCFIAAVLAQAKKTNAGAKQPPAFAWSDRSRGWVECPVQWRHGSNSSDSHASQRGWQRTNLNQSASHCLSIAFWCGLGNGWRGFGLLSPTTATGPRVRIVQFRVTWRRLAQDKERGIVEPCFKVSGISCRFRFGLHVHRARRSWEACLAARTLPPGPWSPLRHPVLPRAAAATTWRGGGGFPPTHPRAECRGQGLLQHHRRTATLFWGNGIRTVGSTGSSHVAAQFKVGSIAV